jgi:tol-pal system protein YbgF
MHGAAVIKRLVMLLAATCAMSAQAGLFDDEEARRAILDLRQRVEAGRQEGERRKAETERLNEDNALMRRSLLDLQGQIDALKTEQAKLQGQNEQLARDLSESQRRIKDATQVVDERLRRFEPIKVTVDGVEFLAEPTEKRDYEAAVAVFRKGEFAAAQASLVDFIRRYPQSGYMSLAFFWLGNAQYATRDYKEAIANFRSMLSQAPQHLRAPEAQLSIANCQIEMKDSKAARKSLEDLVKNFPNSEAAFAAKERLARLK